MQSASNAFTFYQKIQSASNASKYTSKSTIFTCQSSSRMQSTVSLQRIHIIQQSASNAFIHLQLITVSQQNFLNFRQFSIDTSHVIEDAFTYISKRIPFNIVPLIEVVEIVPKMIQTCTAIEWQKRGNNPHVGKVHSHRTKANTKEQKRQLENNNCTHLQWNSFSLGLNGYSKFIFLKRRRFRFKVHSHNAFLCIFVCNLTQT